jgi:trigger factor
MQHTIEKISDSQEKLIVEVDQKVWKDAQAKAFQKVAARVSIPGFRPGKAPKEMVEKAINQEAVYNEAVESVLTPVYSDVLTEEKITPFFRPSVNVTKLTPDALEIVYTIVLFPSVKLGEYKGLKAEKVAPSVTDAEVADSINKLLEGNASLASVEREAKMGDTVVLDFDGYLPDEKGALKAFEGGKADNYSLELGSHQFVPGFEEGVVGMKSGDKKDLKVTFPTNYVKDLAGKEATFKVTVHEVKEKQIPALNDDAVKELHIADVDTVAKLQAHEKESLLKGKVESEENKYYQAIVDQIVANCKFVIDSEIIANEAANLEENLKKQVEQQGLTFEQYLEITGNKEDDLKKTYLAQAEKNIKEFLATEEVAKTEKISVSDADVDAEIKKIADQYKMKEEEVRNVLAKNMEQWKDNLRQKKIHDFILSVSK